MESKNPRAGLNNPVQRGIGKAEAALEWIYPSHFSTDVPPFSVAEGFRVRG